MRIKYCIPAIVLLLLSCSSQKINTSHYDTVIDCAEAEYAVAGQNRRVRFCVVGDGNVVFGSTVAAFEIAPDGSVRRIYIDRDRGFNPWKIEVCELDGDSEPEVALGVFKSARFYPEPDKRLFVYDWNGRFLVPKILGSRLAYPMISFAFARFPDGIDRLVSLERDGEEKYLIRLYNWTGFGFSGEEQTINPRSIDEGMGILEAVENGEGPDDAARRIMR